MVVFDNNQVMQRRWQISLNNDVKSSTITMVAFLEMPQVTLMYSPQFTPAEWMWSQFPADGLEQLFNREALGRRYLYQYHLHPWLTEILVEVAEEQLALRNGQFEDPVDKSVRDKKHSKEFKTCLNCGDINMPRRNRLCRNCNTTISAARFREAQRLHEDQSQEKPQKTAEVRVHIDRHSDTSYSLSYEKQTQHMQSPYEHLGNHHPEKPTEVHMGEPIFLNPCSFDALAAILRDIGRHADIRRYRGTLEWVAVMCDGLPYTLALQLVERFVQCSVCKDHFDGLNDADKHAADAHPEIPDVTFEKEFQWVLLQPGPGHIEINMLKGFVKLMKDIYREDMVELFNFKSDNAKKPARNVSDHHKGWMLARIARESIARELIVQYVCHELSKQEEPQLSVAHFVLSMSKIPIMPFCTTPTSSFWMPCSLTGQVYAVGMGSSSRLHVAPSQSCGQPHTIPCIDSLTPMTPSWTYVCQRSCVHSWGSPAVSTPVGYLSAGKGAISSSRSSTNQSSTGYRQCRLTTIGVSLAPTTLVWQNFGRKHSHRWESKTQRPRLHASPATFPLK